MSYQGRPSQEQEMRSSGGPQSSGVRRGGRGGQNGGSGDWGSGGSRPGGRSKPRRLNIHQKRQLTELVEKSHIPRTAAMRVVMGQSTLNEVLQEMMREEKIKSMMATHGFSRALATSVALGRAELDTILLRRRKNETLESNYDRSILEVYQENASSVSLAVHDHKVVVGRILRIEKYGFEVLPDGEGDPVEVHKTKVKYAFDPKNYKLVRRAHAIDNNVRKLGLAPILRVKDRYHFKNLTLQEAMDSKQSVRVTTLEGDVFEGGVRWFGRWEFALQVKGGVEVTLFRHAVYRMESLERAIPTDKKPRPKGNQKSGGRAKKKRRR